MNGPTICRLPWGSARRTSKPSPRSRVRGTMMRSSASQVLGSPSTGSLEGCQLIGILRYCFGDHTLLVGRAKGAKRSRARMTASFVLQIVVLRRLHQDSKRRASLVEQFDVI